MDLKISDNCQFCKSKKLQIINFFGYFPTVNDYNKKITQSKTISDDSFKMQSL